MFSPQQATMSTLDQLITLQNEINSISRDIQLANDNVATEKQRAHERYTTEVAALESKCQEYCRPLSQRMTELYNKVDELKPLAEGEYLLKPDRKPRVITVKQTEEESPDHEYPLDVFLTHLTQPLAAPLQKWDILDTTGYHSYGYWFVVPSGEGLKVVKETEEYHWPPEMLDFLLEHNIHTAEDVEKVYGDPLDLYAIKIDGKTYDLPVDDDDDGEDPDCVFRPEDHQ